MKRINLLAIAMVLLTTTGCLERGPVYRPVDFVADSLVHDDVPKAAEETQEMLDEL
jgi:predicted small lipoprotein YifL